MKFERELAKMKNHKNRESDFFFFFCGNLVPSKHIKAGKKKKKNDFDFVGEVKSLLFVENTLNLT